MQATVTASAVDHGSALVVTVAGMQPARDLHAGRRRTGTASGTPAGEWPASAAGGGTWRGWADVDRGDLAAVVLLGDGGRELVRALF